MTARHLFLTLMVCSSYLIGCGGGAENNQLLDDSAGLQVDGTTQGRDPVSDSDSAGDQNQNSAPGNRARYRVTLENLWGAEDFPQGFPVDAHLSLVGGATHNVSVSFWDLGEVASRGIEDMAEAGLIDRFLFDEVAPAITNGTADSMIEIREYTDAKIDGVPGVLIFEIEMNVNWPLLTMVTMLGPSPDWFVGVSGLRLFEDGGFEDRALDNEGWITRLSVNLPLYDGGTKSDVTPIMGGPDVIPADPVGWVAYDAATGVYLPSDEPQNVARLTLERIELVQ